MHMDIGTGSVFLLPAECIIPRPHRRAQGGIGDAGQGGGLSFWRLVVPCKQQQARALILVLSDQVWHFVDQCLNKSGICSACFRSPIPTHQQSLSWLRNAREHGVLLGSHFSPPLALLGSLQSSMRLQADAVAAPFFLPRRDDCVHICIPTTLVYLVVGRQTSCGKLEARSSCTHIVHVQVQSSRMRQIRRSLFRSSTRRPGTSMISQEFNAALPPSPQLWGAGQQEDKRGSWEKEACSHVWFGQAGPGRRVRHGP
ncbi:hypothetical protein J3F83DRAFT_34357 [Trichoderma novae-zelandiae]